MEREAVLHIINKFKVKTHNQPFRCILIYQDLETGFIIIRPLLSKIDLEIVMELFKIFTTYGPPSKLHVNSCTADMIDNMQAHMKVFCPMFDIKFVKKNIDSDKIAMKVVMELHQWMENTKREEWEIGCLIIQRQINTQYSTKLNSTPQELFFKFGKDKLEDAAENQDRSKGVSQEQNNTANQEQNRQVKKEQMKHVSQEQNTPRVDQSSLFSNVKIKQEIENHDNSTSMKERMVLFEGGLIFSSLKKPDAHVEVKMERLDE